MLSGLKRSLAVGACAMGVFCVSAPAAEACLFGCCGWGSWWRPPRTYASYYPPTPFAAYGPSACDPCDPCGSPCGPAGCPTGDCGINFVPDDAPRTSPGESFPGDDPPRTYLDEDDNSIGEPPPINEPTMDDPSIDDGFLPREGETDGSDTDAFRPETTIPRREPAPAEDTDLFEMPPNESSSEPGSDTDAPRDIFDDADSARSSDEGVRPILRIDDEMTHRTPVELTRVRHRTPDNSRPIWADLPHFGTSRR